MKGGQTISDARLAELTVYFEGRATMFAQHAAGGLVALPMAGLPDWTFEELASLLREAKAGRDKVQVAKTPAASASGGGAP